MEMGERRLLASPLQEPAQWLPLQKHPVFTTATLSASQTQCNLIAWDAANSRLYLWDSKNLCLHRLSIRFSDDSDPPSIQASSSSKMFHPDIQMHFTVHNISVNANGSSLLLAGSDCLCVMYLFERTSTKDNIIMCRTISIGSGIYFGEDNFIRTLQVSWHPYSNSHLGVLSSDSVFRIYDLSYDVERPEQEFYLQPIEHGRRCSAASICPVAFSFGGEHLWDRFTVFVVFSDGSIYVLCPVVPFGSIYSWTSIEEIYKDAHTFGLNSSNKQAVSNSNLAIAWLEATFPELRDKAVEGGTLLALKARPYVPFDASLLLQGPLRKVHHGEEGEDPKVQNSDCEGRAVSFLYNSISKDSVLVTAWSNGQLQIDALADELQPVWNVGISPRLRIDPSGRVDYSGGRVDYSGGRVVGVAMICESTPQDFSASKVDQQLDHQTHAGDTSETFWLGRSPPLLRLAVVDLALPTNIVNECLLSMFADPLISEKIYSVHGGGIDMIMLHFLPFSNQTTVNETVKAPSVYPILSTCYSDTCSPSPLQGFAMLADSFGNSWIVGINSSCECIVVEMKGWDTIPLYVDEDKKPISYTELSETVTPDIISKELLIGPKAVLIPQASSALRSLKADSIEGRSTLHHYFKLFHENYVEYAHKVYIELKHHEAHLKRIITDQHACLREAKQMLLNVEEKQPSLDDRVSSAVYKYELLEERLRSLRRLPKKPLTRAELEFKSQLDRFTDLELDALRSSIGSLNARLKRYTQSSQGNTMNSPRQIPGRRKNNLPEAQISHLKSSISKLSLVNSENTKKVKLVESVLQSQESGK
ncbi:nuclear pore complex protein-like protein isoform X1 [Tasmannia lanceolata]|uniref:nuclear pore complex protein-like protein isoform X1 n=1 Tax=Tasmannia lanceolata TaxID=3420 RepID=UPI004064367B